MPEAQHDAAVEASAPSTAVEGGGAPSVSARPVRNAAQFSRAHAAVMQRTAGNRGVARLAGRLRAGAPLARAMLQRDAVTQQRVIDALAKPASGTDAGAGDAGARTGYVQAFLILNGLAMYDLLSTLTALRRSGQFDALNANFAAAQGVYVDRLRVAFDAVIYKGPLDIDDFLVRHQATLLLLPLDQRENIIKYLDFEWFDSLKFAEDTDAGVAAVKATPAYAALDAPSKALTEEIIVEVRKNPDPDAVAYYLVKLKLLFDTPEDDPGKIADDTNAQTATAVVAEKKRVAKPAEAKNTGLEEKASASKKRVWVAKAGKFGGGTYYVDSSQPTDIYVKARVYLKPAGKGTAADVAAVKKMEDGIEKAASTKGYTVDVIFVNTPAKDELGNDPFTVDVDPGEWEVATNWSGGAPLGFAHELHHMFAFELDRYDYIESHAGNTEMKIPNRLYWFRQELTKPPGYNDPTSIMSSAAHPNDDDVCRVAGLDPAIYVPIRRKAREVKAKKGGAKAKP